MIAFASGPNSNSNSGEPTATQHLIASFDPYIAAQAVVDRVSDDGFPAENERVVEDGVRTIGQLTGRMMRGKAALAPAVSGRGHSS